MKYRVTHTVPYINIITGTIYFNLVDISNIEVMMPHNHCFTRGILRYFKEICKSNVEWLSKARTRLVFYYFIVINREIHNRDRMIYNILSETLLSFLCILFNDFTKKIY